MARSQGANASLIAGFETVYGTPPADGFHKLPFVSSTLGSDQPLVADDSLGNGRDPLAPTREIITVDGDIVVPVDVRNSGFWLKGLLGEPTTTGAGPYVHTFTSGAATLPSLTLEVGNPEVPSFRQYPGNVVDSLAWSFQTSGTASMTAKVIGQGEIPGTTTVDSTPTKLVYTRFSPFQGSIEKDGVALGNVTGGELTYANNLDAVRTIRDDGKIDGADPTVASLTGSITVRFADMALFDAATAGTPIELVFGYEINSTKRLVLTAHEVHLPRPRISIQGPGGIEATFNWQASAQADGGVMFTAALTNDVAAY